MPAAEQKKQLERLEYTAIFDGGIGYDVAGVTEEMGRG